MKRYVSFFYYFIDRYGVFFIRCQSSSRPGGNSRGNGDSYSYSCAN